MVQEEHLPGVNMANRTDQAKQIAGEYMGKSVVAELDGRLFDHRAAKLGFRFMDPAKLKAELEEGYEDYLEDWDLSGTTVPVAAVSMAGSTSEFAWLFLDWSEGKEAPRVLVTTTDRWEIADKYTVANLGELGLRVV
jgi:hypothetical protein